MKVINILTFAQILLGLVLQAEQAFLASKSGQEKKEFVMKEAEKTIDEIAQSADNQEEAKEEMKQAASFYIDQAVNTMNKSGAFKSGS